MKRIVKLFGLLLLLAVVATVPLATTQSQDEDSTACDDLIDAALSEIANICTGIGINEACYGSPTVSAVLRDESMFFEAAGDMVPVTALETVITRPIDPDTGEWGIVVMDIQADLPDSTDEAVRLLLYGGVEIEPAAVYDTACTITNGEGSVNIYAGPGQDYATVDVWDAGATLAATGRSEDESWYLTASGWVAADGVAASCDMAELPPASSTGITYAAPMQAFTVQMDEEARCEAAPAGILVQTPEGQTAHLMVNNVELSIGSTAFISLRTDETAAEEGTQALTISNLEGTVSVFAQHERQEIGPGYETKVQVRHGRPVAPPPPPAEVAGPVVRARLHSPHLPNLVRTGEFRGVRRPGHNEILPPRPPADPPPGAADPPPADDGPRPDDAGPPPPGDGRPRP